MMTKFLLVIFSLVIVASAQQKSRAVQNYFCNDELNAQVKMEFKASHAYLSLSNFYAHDSQALLGFSKMFEHHWKEELEHAEKMINYISKRGGVIDTPVVEAPQNDKKWHDGNSNVCKVLQQVLDLEKSVTTHLLDVVHPCGRGQNKNNKEDPQLQDFVEGEFLGEQVDGIKEVADLLTRLERASSPDCSNSLGVHIVDQELLHKYGK